MEHWCVATDRVRYVGEPVAIAVAEDRYRAEDALAAIDVRYEPLPAAVDPEATLAPDAPLLHEAIGSNLISERHFSYGDPEAAFTAAPHRIETTVRYPRNACTPMECLGLVASYHLDDESYDVLSNFQGPFALHPVMARALKVPGPRLRLRSPPDSGGSFGVKQAIFPYVVGMSLAARKARRPVKWIEDRLEHLVAATSATNRVTRIEAAVEADGTVTALRLNQLEDCGAYLRAPEPATLYRNHGNLTGPYRIPNLAVTNRVVATNKTPTGLNRGFGGPQLYYALERLMQRVAVTLDLDPLDVINRNLVPRDAHPYRAAAGALFDSGDFPGAVARAIDDGKLDALRAKQETARAEGRLYGIGYAAAVEPSISNMGYITTVLSADDRRKAGPKDGALAHATIAVEPLGGVSVTAESIPQGQGHRTVLAQVVGEALGLSLEKITVNLEHDTQKDPWSIAAGNYSSRFSGAVAGAAHNAAQQMKARLARIASQQLNVPPDGVSFENGRVFATDNPDNALSFGRVAALAHWSPSSLPNDMPAAVRETATWTPPALAPPSDDDVINSSAAYGFIFDFCGVEIDRTTGAVEIDRYVTTHDAGRRLNPALVDGQIRGAFAHAVGAALYEEFTYGADGSFLSGTLADYLVPTACEIPDPEIFHHDIPSTVTPLGAKGVGEGNCMTTPVCLANAVANALDLEHVDLPLTPPRVSALINESEPPPPSGPVVERAPSLGGRALSGSGSHTVDADPERVWSLLLDPTTLRAMIPGCERLDETAENAYSATAVIRIGPIRSRFDAEVALSDLEPPRALRLTGTVTGPLGTGRGSGRVRLAGGAGGTRIEYDYDAEIGGKVASVGGRMLDGAAKLLISQFFAALARHVGRDDTTVVGETPSTAPLWKRLLRLLGLAS
jgi:2-furoyl-CoA dehydrogenase large subunit